MICAVEGKSISGEFSQSDSSRQKLFLSNLYRTSEERYHVEIGRSTGTPEEGVCGG